MTFQDNALSAYLNAAFRHCRVDASRRVRSADYSRVRAYFLYERCRAVPGTANHGLNTPEIFLMSLNASDKQRLNNARRRLPQSRAPHAL